MFRILAAAGLVGLAFGAPSAGAVEIVNEDATPQSIEIIQGGETVTETLAPGETRTDLCAEGCDLKHDNMKLSELLGEERLVIRDGKIDFVD